MCLFCNEALLAASVHSKSCQCFVGALHDVLPACWQQDSWFNTLKLQLPAGAGYEVQMRYGRCVASLTAAVMVLLCQESNSQQQKLGVQLCRRPPWCVNTSQQHLRVVQSKQHVSLFTLLQHRLVSWRNIGLQPGRKT